jgi:glycosyltransferase involved in cell wall biosynthesis
MEKLLRMDALWRELTVVIPAYGCVPFLPAAIESALHSPAASILIADDASGPDVLRIADRYADAHPDRIQVLRAARNRGTANNLNEAVRHVRTPYFAKLDGDDVLIPSHLEAALPVMVSRPRLAIIAGHEIRIAANEFLEFQAQELPCPSSGYASPQVMAGAGAYRFILAWKPNPCSSGTIYRTEAFREIGGFDPTLEWGEDWEIWLRFAQRWEVAYCDSASALYRIHPQSATASGIRENRLCFGYDGVFRRAAEVCRHPEIRPVLRRAFLWVARLYAAAALRRRGDWLLYGHHAARALAAAVFLVDGA